MRPDRPNKRTGLFLVRIWIQRELDSSGKSVSVCSGKVQRVVDGESHQFSDWQTLCEKLAEMLPTTEGR